jgi:hypothetical protein
MESTESSSNNNNSSRSSSDEDLLGKGDLISERNLLSGKDIFAEFTGFVKEGRKSFDREYRTKSNSVSSKNEKHNKKQDLHCETSRAHRQSSNVGPQSAPSFNKNASAPQPRSAVKVVKS